MRWNERNAWWRPGVEKTRPAVLILSATIVSRLVCTTTVFTCVTNNLFSSKIYAYASLCVCTRGEISCIYAHVTLPANMMQQGTVARYIKGGTDLQLNSVSRTGLKKRDS